MNQILFTNPTGANPAITATGDSPNIDIPLVPQGAGQVKPTALLIPGITNGSLAPAGTVGEVISSLVATGSAVSMTDATGKNITSISLTAGDWDVSGNVNLNLGSATVTASSAGISTTSATVPTDGTEVPCGLLLTTTTDIQGIAIPRKPINVTTTTTVYLVAIAAFSAGTVAGWGSITARRVR